MASQTTSPRSKTGWERFSASFLRPATSGSERTLPVFDQMSDEEKRQYISRIDPTERTIALAAAVLGTLLALVVNVPYMVKKIVVTTPTKPIANAHGHGYHCLNALTFVKSGTSGVCKGIYPPSHYILPLVLSLVLSLAIFVTVRLGKRTQVAFTTMIAGLAFGSLFIVVPFLLVGGWVMIRAYRCQKNGAPNVRTPLAGWTPPPPRSGARRTRGQKVRPTSANPTFVSPRPKEPNKRYTPKAKKPNKK